MQLNIVLLLLIVAVNAAVNKAKGPADRTTIERRPLSHQKTNNLSNHSLRAKQKIPHNLANNHQNLKHNNIHEPKESQNLLALSIPTRQTPPPPPQRPPNTRNIYDSFVPSMDQDRHFNRYQSRPKSQERQEEQGDKRNVKKRSLKRDARKEREARRAVRKVEGELDRLERHILKRYGHFMNGSRYARRNHFTFF